MCCNFVKGWKKTQLINFSRCSGTTQELETAGTTVTVPSEDIH